LDRTPVTSGLQSLGVPELEGRAAKNSCRSFYRISIDNKSSSRTDLLSAAAFSVFPAEYDFRLFLLLSWKKLIKKESMRLIYFKNKLDGAVTLTLKVSFFAVAESKFKIHRERHSSVYETRFEIFPSKTKCYSDLALFSS
jgi:hypothetical protein